MTEIARDDVLDALENSGLDADALQDDYSGRGMFGDVCFGIVHDTVGELLRWYAAMHPYAPTLGEVGRQDSMGRSTITYFPGYTVSDE